MPSALSIVQKFYPEVTKTVFAKKPLTINLRATDVKKAKSKKHDSCAMAEACKRQCGADGAVVSTYRAYLIKGNKATMYRVPPNVAREIVAFDRGAGFTPGEYQLKGAVAKTIYVPPEKAHGGGTKTGHRSRAMRTPGLRAALSTI